ncbi:two-component system sensor histidine kinase AgrC [Natranaerovirga hydrolytica]|uniref:Two-component system sensor histidine kinase AgrC n=1 Tax=Natranaerovirga hydrolytica TaxID=680378 RepID=A0A4R1N7D5_9FIRM|nr:two-component system sensor histidine kinase AgrC [Natranaerovirga hydrolytica]
MEFIWYERVILTIFEAISILFIWAGINKKIKESKISRKIILVLLMITMVEMSEYYSLIITNLGIHFVILFLLVIFIFKLEIKSSIFEFFLVTGLMIMIQVIITYIISILITNFDYNFKSGLMVNSVMVIFCGILIRSNLLKSIQKLYVKYTTLILSIMLNLFLCSILVFSIWRVHKNLIFEYFPILISLVIIWTVINFYFSYQRIKIIQQKQVILTHEKYIPYLRSLVDEVRQRQHDIKNHFNVIYGLTEIEKDNISKVEIKNYLKSIVGRDQSIDCLLNIKDAILAAIIYNKKSLAEEKDIEFDFNINMGIPEYPLKNYELVELLGNLLDNAIEETEKTPNKKISLTLGRIDHKSLIQVTNTTTNDIDVNKVFEKGYSTKKGKYRGYGLYNVQKIINYYNGIIELSFNGEDIIFKILF